MNRSSSNSSAVHTRSRWLSGPCISVLILIFSVPGFSQKKDSIYDPNKTVIFKNGKFKVYNNWLSAGGGEAYNFSHYGKQFTLGADYNFHIKQEYFQLGFYFVGDRFGSYNDFNYHLAYGRRIETNSINFAYFAGLAYSTGFKKVNGFFSPDNVYDQLGLYGCVQFIKKITYDTGIGPGLYFNINQYQTMAGLRLDVFFSGAYKGKVKN
jgi:hypothetical protein